NVSIADLHRHHIDDIKIKCKECGKPASRITEIFDSWVEAGSMPFAEFHYPFDQKEVFESRFPAQFVAEYIAQTRAWFYVMHVIGFNLFGKAPFENVVTTGTILAEDGSKMSKSKNNYPDPWVVIEKYGVDALRFYLMNSTVMQADNLNFSERELGVVYRKNVLILWNVYNYFVTYANEAGWYRPTGTFHFKKIDRWLECREYELLAEVSKHLDNYDTVRATRVIEKFIDDLSTWYLRRSRGRKDPEFFYSLYGALLTVSHAIAPIMPYLSELIYQNLNADKGFSDIPSIHLSKWLAKMSPEKDQYIIDQMQLVRNLVEQGHGLRKSSNIKLRQPLSSFTYVSKDALSKEFEEILADELNVKSVKIGDKLEFDLNITPELKKEGLAAELERSVQELRKKSGLKVGEVINLTYDTNDGELIAAFDLFDTKKTYVNKISQGSGGEEQEIDGKKVAILLSK
ncbi:MAG: class I tRNA ligase family protein, partial [Candidatus Doudnabacteria bacterium]|nr:class I tRNA ligase family protein [Candidatus Doudnabacteria bacterium]